MYKLKKPRPAITVSIKTGGNDFWWKIKIVPLKRAIDAKKVSADLIDYAQKVIKTCTENTTIKVHFNKTLFVETKK